MTFVLHPQLEKDTLPLADLPLCELRLMNDSQYPWVILVPKRQAVRDITDLEPADQDALWPELARVEAALKSVTNAEKMNVAALGNMVPQLHIHVIARFREDPAWPKPVWGQVPAVPYAPTAAESFRTALADKLGMSDVE
jgi:diadenosine tetraphosphate (Ap4A) HIT family hydrolase